MNDRVDAGNVEGGLELRVHGGIVTNGSGNHRQRRADQRSRRIAATLSRTLIVHEKESQLAPTAHGTSEAAPELILPELRLHACQRIAGLRHIEDVLRVEFIVA